MTAPPLLSVRDLHLHFTTPEGDVHALRGVDLDVMPGECLGIVGESGCGKSQLLASLMGLWARSAAPSGVIHFAGQDVTQASPRALQALRGRRIAMVFQDPMTALNPHLTIGRQLTEGVRHHLHQTAAEARARALELLHAVHLSDAERRLRQYPHELSGGMRQRVVIAMALACRPELLLADEPTTALDVTVQAQILALLRELRARFGLTILLVTHDLGVIAQVADRVAVMYAGRIVEHGTLADVFTAPAHPYAQALRLASPTLDTARGAHLAAIPGQPPDLAQPIRGCAFAPRCTLRTARCEQESPALAEVSLGHSAACFHSDQLRNPMRPGNTE
ncbi:MAG: ABC transporter ATP-binding protein [Nevskiaceae bacterium]|nr:MAG: ABC transporter ATP-binding protein [Nevskiaceae bacterium]TBR72071.1 MAG: ABC transporter ATP-binding protein [Nevskiaceae bacterium]